MSRRPRPRLSSPRSLMNQASSRPFVGPGKPKNASRSYVDVGAEAEAALAQVVEIEIPVDALRRLAAQQLERVELVSIWKPKIESFRTRRLFT